MNAHRILCISHCIEWAQGHGKLINDVIVSIVFLLDKLSKSFFILRAGAGQSGERAL